MRLSSIVQNLRIKRGMGRAELARRAKLDRTTMLKIETGDYYPAPETQQLMADALGVTVNSLTDPSVCPLCGQEIRDNLTLERKNEGKTGNGKTEC